MTAPTKRNAPVARGASVETVEQTNAKPTADRRELQGIATARQARQRPPTWPELPGERAMRLLGNLWGPPKQANARRRR